MNRSSDNASQSDKFFHVFSGTVEFFQRLITSVAVGSGALAIIFYNDKIVPYLSWMVIAFGLVLFFVSFMLAFFSAADWFRTHTKNIKNKFLEIVIATVVVCSTTFFLIAGLYAAIASLKT